MKLKNGVIQNEIAGEYYLADTGAEGKRFNGMVKLNETGIFIVNNLNEETTEEKIAEAMCKEYDVTYEIALANVKKTVESLKSIGLIKNGR